jgi:nucleoside-diphosphate-sugar epimerase
MKKILVTGDKGYIGTILTEILISNGYEVEGLDIGYFEDCKFFNDKEKYNSLKIDIRNIESKHVEKYDTVIHLAGLSNDPLGELEKSVTYEINRDASIRLADLCKKNGVKKFIYFSTQSIYGISQVDDELDEYKSVKNPITAYALSKWEAEQYITNLGDDKFHVNALRPSTVFGASNRLRSDIIFNNFMSNAHTTNIIEIKSDGSPIRPAIHIIDLCSAVLALLKNKNKKNNNKSYNVGKKKGNYTVREIADVVQKKYPEAKIFYSSEHGKDSRSYRVAFNKIYDEFGNFYRPQWNLTKGADELYEFFNKVSFVKNDLFGIKTNRLNKLKDLISKNLLDTKLVWKKTKE